MADLGLAGWRGRAVTINGNQGTDAPLIRRVPVHHMFRRNFRASPARDWHAILRCIRTGLGEDRIIADLTVLMSFAGSAGLCERYTRHLIQVYLVRYTLYQVPVYLGCVLIWSGEQVPRIGSAGQSCAAGTDPTEPPLRGDPLFG